MIIHIKNIVCGRCVMLVRSELQGMGLTVVTVRMGVAEVREELTSDQLTALRIRLEALGFELIADKQTRIIEQIKCIIINEVHSDENERNRNLSDLICAEIGMDYRYLSALFSANEGYTIEKYHILQKVERVKELLDYDELTLSEIAFRMGYSSNAHLSNQFKRVTGMTPTSYKREKAFSRR
ncbi:MAG: helix-turn-helix domain-containing protein, partial [Bacteroidales bacterium]